MDRVRKERLIELSVFLRECRARIVPETVGLSRQSGRRVRGLRREEVAARAGISLDWYVRIEQGRDINPSAGVLDAIASALALSEAERRHLGVLADRRQSQQQQSFCDTAALERMITRLAGSPTYLFDPAWNVLAQNDAAAELWGTWHDKLQPSNNFLFRFFTDPCFTEQLEDWETHARIVVRQYRAVFARQLADRRISRLVREVADASPAFADWWTGSDIDNRDTGRKVFNIPSRGQLVMDYVILRPAGNDDVEVVAFLPVP